MSFILTNTEKSIIGYKVGCIEPLNTNVCPDLSNMNKGRVLITLQIAQGVITNLRRKNVVQPKFAQYRTSQAFVLQIEVLDPKTLQPQDLVHTAHNFFYYPYKDYDFVYETGTYVCPDFFDPCETNEISQGIHFYLDKTTAIHQAIDSIYNGPHILRRPNGTVRVKVDYEEFQEVQRTYYSSTEHIQEIIQRQNGIYHGIHRQYYTNSPQILSEHRYQLGQLMYPSIYYNSSGTFRVEVHYVEKNDKFYLRVFQESVWILEQPLKMLVYNHEVFRHFYYKYCYDLIMTHLLRRWYLCNTKLIDPKRLGRERL